MERDELVALITEEVIAQLKKAGWKAPDKPVPPPFVPQEKADKKELPPDFDIASEEVKKIPLLENPIDPVELSHMKKRTTARIGVGKCGARLNTQTMLTLRADHAKARDAVMKDVDENLLKSMDLFSVKTQCDTKDTFITRPDLGRRLSPEGVETLKEKCAKNPDVQIYAADGLSSTAINANLDKIMPVLMKGLESKGLTVGTPFFMKYGRVAAEDQVAEIVGAKVVCVLIGERPGLATSESMSAYIVYNAHVGIPESKRTVVSNIHKDGLSAVEAGAYIVEVIEKILAAKASGVDLVK